MASAGWGDLAVKPVAGQPGHFTGDLAQRWMLLVVPLGGAVVALASRAMAATLDVDEQSLHPPHPTVCARFVICRPTGDLRVRPPGGPFWDEVLESQPATGQPPWKPVADGPAEAALWYRPTNRRCWMTAPSIRSG